MFCRWCGKKITTNARPCPSCGREQDALENGYGFWDLCKYEPASEVRSAEPAAGVNQVPPANQNRKPSRRSKVLLWTLLPILGVFMLASAVGMGISAVKTNRCLKQIRNMKSEQTGLSAEMKDMKSEMDLMSRDFGSVQDNLSELKRGVDQLADGSEGSTEEPDQGQDAAELDFDSAELEPMTTMLILKRFTYAPEGEDGEAQRLLTAERGETPTRKPLAIRWEMSTDSGESWEDVPEEYLVMEDLEAGKSIIRVSGDNEIYRVVYYYLNQGNKSVLRGFYAVERVSAGEASEESEDEEQTENTENNDEEETVENPSPEDESDHQT